VLDRPAISAPVDGEEPAAGEPFLTKNVT